MTDKRTADARNIYAMLGTDMNDEIVSILALHCSPVWHAARLKGVSHRDVAKEIVRRARATGFDFNDPVDRRTLAVNPPDTHEHIKAHAVWQAVKTHMIQVLWEAA